MSKLPRVSGRECRAAFERLGFEFKRQTGSHMILRRSTPFAQIVIPDHKELDSGTLRGILRSADISIDTFVEKL